MSLHSYNSLMETLSGERSSLREAIYASASLSIEEKDALEERASRLEQSFNFIMRKLVLLPGSGSEQLQRLEDFVSELEWLIDSPDEPMRNAAVLSETTKRQIENIAFSFSENP